MIQIRLYDVLSSTESLRAENTSISDLFCLRIHVGVEVKEEITTSELRVQSVVESCEIEAVKIIVKLRSLPANTADVYVVGLNEFSTQE